MLTPDERRVPRWLELQAEIDYTNWQIRELQKHVAARGALAVAIDQTTGYEDELRAEVDELIERHRVLMAEWDGLDAADS